MSAPHCYQRKRQEMQSSFIPILLTLNIDKSLSKGDEVCNFQHPLLTCYSTITIHKWVRIDQSRVICALRRRMSSFDRVGRNAIGNHPGMSTNSNTFVFLLCKKSHTFASRTDNWPITSWTLVYFTAWYVCALRNPRRYFWTDTERFKNPKLCPCVLL